MPAAAPTGTVALVFTDVQGSTSLWERAPDAMRAALGVHDAVVRRAIEGARGYEVKTEGDAFMVAFASALDAVRFCLDAQQALLAAAWPPEILALEAASDTGLLRGLRVRMGVHAGDPDCRPDPVTGRMDYYGPVVNRAARIGAAGHGGQVLVSEPVFREVDARRAELGDPVIVDLGEHRLKDLESADRLWQVLPRALAARTFPPLKTLDARKTNLQPHPTAFVGREADLAAVHALFEKGGRLVTLLGPGGTGKTRLSMRYAAVHLDDYARDGGGGAWFCDLTEARNLDGVCAAVGTALNVPLVTGKTSAEIVAQLGRAIAGRGRVLVILDNFEQVIECAAETVAPWLRAAPEARFLVSSQERLRLPGEAPLELKPLPVPEGGDARASEAVQLFVERARAVRPGWTLADADVDAVAAIVRELDGIPLAIELAAARVGVLPPAKILERLPRRFDLLGGARRDATSRQATLRGAIDWSWNLLKPHEQDALAQASVFHGGFTLEAAEAVLDLSSHEGAPWPLDVVESLRDKSLLRAWEPPGFAGELRFGMYANIRQYAQEKLDADGARAEAAKSRHAEYYLRAGEEWAASVDGPRGRDVLARLGLERDNLVTVFHRAKVAPASAASAANAVRAMLAIDPVLSTRGPFAVHLGLLDEAVACAEKGGIDAKMRARLLEARGRARRIRGRMADARADLDAALAAAESAGDPTLQARILWQIGTAQLQQGAVADSLTTIERGLALAQSAKDRLATAHLLAFQASILGELGRTTEARDVFGRALALFREVGARAAEGRALSNMANVLLHAGALEDARAAYEDALRIHREMEDLRFEGNALGNLAGVFLEQERYGEARSCYARALEIQRDVGNRRSEGAFRGNLAILEQLEGHVDVARAGFAAAVEALAETGERRGMGLYLAYRGAAEAMLGDEAAATRSLEDATRALSEVGEKTLVAAAEVLSTALDLHRAREASSRGSAAEATTHRSAAEARLKRVLGEGGDPGLLHSEDVRLARRLIERMLASEETAPQPRSTG